MRDIGNRIRRYRLSRYAPPDDPVRRGLRWVWAFGVLWLLWAGLISDHSFFRIWRLAQDNAHAERDLEQSRRDNARIDSELGDPKAGRERAERVLRERNGMAKRGEIIYRVEDDTPDSLAR